MFKSGKRLLSLTLAVSVFAVAVSAISTFAWFQIGQVAVPNVDDAALVQSDSTDLVVNDVTGYKYKYNDVSYGVTDYNNGEPVSYEASSLENVDQADRKELDYPASGEGFYIVGNDSWVSNYNTATGSSASSDTAWTYASGLRLDDDLVDGNNNKATYNNIFLSAGTEFRIRHHYLTVNSDQTQTENYSSSWHTITLANTSETTTAAEIPSGSNNIKIKTGQSGYYNIYLTNSDEIAFYPLELRATPRALLRKARRGLNNTTAQQKKHHQIWITVQKSNGWTNAGNTIYLTKANITYSSGYNLADLISWLNNFAGSEGYGYTAVNNNTKLKYTATDQTTYLKVQFTGTVSGTHYDYSTNYIYVLPPFVTAASSIYTGDGFSRAGNFSFSTSGSIASTSRRHHLTWWSDSDSSYGQFNDSDTTIDSNFDLWLYTDTISYSFAGQTNPSSVTKYRFTKFTVNSPSTATYDFDGWWSSSNYSGTQYTPGASVMIEDTITIYGRYVAKATYFKLYVYKKKHDGTLTVVTNGTSVTGTNDSFYEPPSSYTTVSRYTWNIGKWYTSKTNSTFSGEYTESTPVSTNSGSPVSLYTYVDENTVDLTVIKKYLNDARTSVSSTGTTTVVNGSTAGIYADSSYTLSGLNSYSDSESKALNVPKNTQYEFIGYSTTQATGGVITSNTFTSNTTVYALFGPKQYTVYEYKTYYAYNGSSYVDFSSVFAKTTHATATGYATTNFAKPGNLSAEYKVLSSNTTISGVLYPAGVYKFVFDNWYTGTNSTTCDYNTVYTASKPTGTRYLFGRMKCVLTDQTTLYADTATPGWGGLKLHEWASNAGGNDITLTKVFSSGTIYSFSVPNDINFFLWSGVGNADGNNKTINISVSNNPEYKASTSSAKHGGSAKTSLDNLIIIWGTTQTFENDNDTVYYDTYHNRGYGWGLFYGIGDDNSYYLVGSSSFENGSGNIPWTFVSDNKMSTSNLPLSVVAKYEDRTLTAGMEFKIWHFSSTNGRDGEYAILNSDAETQAVLKINASGNIEVKDGVSGTFDIYVTETTYKVMVKDVNANTKLYTNYDSTTNNYTMGKTPSGSSYLAVYEQGIHVTTAMATSGVYVGIVRQFGGIKTSYGTKAADYSFVTTGASKTFDGETFTCLKINKAGYYNFYLKNDGTIMITSLPYQVSANHTLKTGGDDGYYIIPYSDTYGNATYRNGLKMNVIKGESATTAEGNKNIANYSRYKATAGEKFIIKYFENNITKYSPLEIATDDTTSECLAYEGNGVYRFKQDGVYNIFMYKTGDERRAISVARDSLSDFSRLNSIPSNADDTSKVKSANTTLILDITFTITTPVNMGISLSSIISGAGLSTYVLYGLFVDADYSGASGSTSTQRIYNYFRGSTPYGALVAMRNNATISASGTFADGQHHAYIVIDYDPSQVSSLPTGVSNNFHFILRAIQPAAA